MASSSYAVRSNTCLSPRRRRSSYLAAAAVALLGGLAVAQEADFFKAKKLDPRNYGSQYTDDNGTPFTVSNGGNTLTTANFTYTWNGPPLCRYVRPDGGYFEFFEFGATKFTYPSGKMVTGSSWKKP